MNDYPNITKIFVFCLKSIFHLLLIKQILIGGLKFNPYLYIYFVLVFWCLSVCLSPINVKTAEPIGPMTTGRFIDAQN